MDLEGISLRKVSQRKTNNCMISLLSKWNLKTKQINQNENRLIDTENKLVVARREGNRRVGKVGQGD